MPIVKDEILRTIQSMYSHMITATVPDMDDDDVMSLVNPVNCPYRLVGEQVTSKFEIGWKPLNNMPVTFRVNSSVVWVDENNKVVNEPKPSFQYTADPTLIQSITDYIQFKYEMRKDFGRLRQVIYSLFEEGMVYRRRSSLMQPLYTRKEIRYFFPSILTLLQRSGVSTEGLEEITVPRREKYLPYGLRQAVSKASETVAGFLLLAELRSKPEAPRISFYMDTNYAQHDEDGFTFWDFT